jgi:putative ABC transport system substrate-binding protein
MNCHFRGVLVALALMVGLLSCHSGSQKVAGTHSYRLFIAKYQTTEWMNTVERGIVDELQSAGLRPGENLHLSQYSADGVDTVATQIAYSMVKEAPDLIFTISTPMSQKVKAATGTIPIVFGAITDPVSAGLVRSESQPGGNVTGTTDRWPTEAQLQLIREIAPAAKKLGLVFNPGEANALFDVREIRSIAPKMGLVLVEATAASTAEVPQAAQSLVGRVDAIFIPACNTAITAAPAIAKVGRLHHIPVFAGEPSSVEQGALAAYSFDYYALGRLTGLIGVKILRQGIRPADIPISAPPQPDLYLNSEAARGFGITLAPALLAKAKRDFGRAP